MQIQHIKVPNTIKQNTWVIFVTLNACFRNEEMSKMNDFIFHIRKVSREGQIKPTVRRM
jgi:archaellum biogenesis ATPase FlaH